MWRRIAKASLVTCACMLIFAPAQSLAQSAKDTRTQKLKSPIEISTKHAIVLQKSIPEIGKAGFDINEYEEIVIDSKLRTKSTKKGTYVHFVYFVYDTSVHLFGSTPEHPNWLVVVDGQDYSIIHAGPTPP